MTVDDVIAERIRHGNWIGRQEMNSKREALQEIGVPDPPLRPRPVLICRDGRIVGDAVVIVSPRDPNWYRNYLVKEFDGEIRVQGPVNRRL